ncbi:NnrS family protein [Kiloniella sp. b19]|uniref:NnrS family protein n=1 Tax=Kiloniella sp. GXU_MW_B19 TaxID=3141326 RepID=UPI0031D78D1B
MASSAEQIRAWKGPALLSYGFRPFFLGGALWAALSMVLWIGLLAGWFELPTRFDPVSWHAHEFLFGYLGAIVAGFLLTAVPNWTGRLPLVGWSLAALFSLWIVGRVTIALSGLSAPLLSAALDLLMPVTLMLVLAREVVAGRNWRNAPVLLLLSVFIAGNAVFHWEVATGEYAASGLGVRIGLGAAVMMIALIGGRIVPSFTHNWLKKQGETRMPASFGLYDKLALLVLLGAVGAWIVTPHGPLAAWSLLLAGVLHLVRLARWKGYLTLPDALVWVLHAGYATIPLGALVIAATTLLDLPFSAASSQHLWMAGGIGLMTLAVMTRATLGHTGHELVADIITSQLYLLVIVSVLARILVDLVPEFGMVFYQLSGLCWVAAFGGFALSYGRKLVSPRRN